MTTNGTTTTNGGICLSVDTNTTWAGYITLSATLASATGSVAAASAAPSITVSGAGGNYASGDTITKLQLNTPAQVLGALSGNSCNDSVVLGPINVQARDNVVTLLLNTGSATAACATAIGE